MKKPATKYILLSLGAFVLVGTTAVVAYDRVCFDPITEITRTIKEREGTNGPNKDKVKELPFLEKLEAQMCARRDRPDAEKAKEKQAAMERAQKLEEQAKMTRPDAPSTTSEIPNLGKIVDEWKSVSGSVKGANEFFKPSEFRVFTSITMRVEGKIVQAFSGYSPADPTQGSIFVSAPGGGMDGARFYSTPSTTGPVKIISEKGGLLALESVAGEFEQQEPGGGAILGKVKTAGGSTYYFDLKTRTFK